MTLLPEALAGIDAALAAGFPQVKINCVLMRGRDPSGLTSLVEFAAEKQLLLRFIELMPVSTTEVLSETTFLPVNEAKRTLEAHFGALIPQPEFKTNGPATYYQIPGRDQRVGFIGAMTNLHFCDSCNKLRLTCDGKLRPCLGSYLEFDIMKPVARGDGRRAREDHGDGHEDQGFPEVGRHGNTRLLGVMIDWLGPVRR